MASSSMARHNYQVFLSFRGADIRKTFIDHLYTRLDDAGIRTFKDDEELEKGKNIESELQTAILESRIAIIVFSENYASSRWCLDELVRILECKNNAGLEILPVFYHVEPSQVRYQHRGSFSAAFEKHEKRFMHKIAGWKAALREVADLGGMELQDGYESNFIKKIVQVVENKLKRTTMNVPCYLVGIHDRVKNINKWLQDGSSEVGILTIHGTGGIGKTTIAKIVYNRNCSRFEACCFLSNVREVLQQPDGLLRLYKKLLTHMLRADKVKIGSPDEGINKIRDVISCKKILLVIDDVDQKNRLKLEPLLGMHHLFYKGSKIIVTTRHKQLLKGPKVNEYELLKFDRNESLNLFSWHAFGQDFPLKEYLEHSKRVVSYCDGLPLALHVLGSSLYGESVDVWTRTLEKLEEIPNAEIFEILRVSYDSLLDDNDKNIFLEIACFFIGKEKNHVVTILNACHFHTIGLDNLINRSLIKIDENTKKIMMHQLLRDMGREIVRQESPYEPGMRRRLWHHKDSFNVLKHKSGTRKIEGLVLNMDSLKEDKTSLRSCNINNDNDMDLETNAFAEMHKLRLLQISNVQLIGGYKQFPKNLKYLCWNGLFWKYVPRDFPLENLVVIDIRHSNLKTFSTGAKVLRHVKILKLSHCHCLTRTPEFSQFPSLERLILKDCVSLVEVHKSIVEVEGLIFLNLTDCRSLRKLPSNIGMLKVLETLIISGCLNLEEWPTDLKGMERLKMFCADGISLNISQSTIDEEKSWRDFILSLVLKPKRVPLLSWDSLPHYLVNLSLVNCNLFDNAFPDDFCNMPFLENLNLGKNPIYFLPNCVKRCTRLNNLNLYGCERLKTVIGLPPNILNLILRGCLLLEKVTYQEHQHDLPLVFMEGCEKLVDIEDIFKVAPIEEIDAEIVNYLGLNTYDLESMKSIEIILYNSYTCRMKKGPIQGVSEYDDMANIPGVGHSRTDEQSISLSSPYVRGVYVFNIFLPGDSNIQSSCTYRTEGQSISLAVPSSPPNAKLRGLTLFAVYAFSLGRQIEAYLNYYIIAEISNETKGTRWQIRPVIYAVPGGGEDIIWLSHWNLESHHLEAGDEIYVTVSSKYHSTDELTVYEIKQVGINFVCEGREQMSVSQTVKKLRPGITPGKNKMLGLITSKIGNMLLDKIKTLSSDSKKTNSSDSSLVP